MLETAIEAAAEAGKLLRKNFGSTLNVSQATHHDIKLEIDEQTQKLITKVILADYPDHAILGEEGVSGRKDAEVRWVIDPLDGTVNYFYGIPHYAVSIAAQVRSVGATSRSRSPDPGRGQEPAPTKASTVWETVAGVVLDPELDELFVSEKGQPAMLHGYPIHVSNRAQLTEAIVAIGFFKSVETINRSLQDFGQLIHKVRKLRLMGAASLDAVYVACGRFDVYIEYGIKLWDIAAGELILENAGGRTVAAPTPDPNAFDVRMWNGKLPLDDLQLGTDR